jgi:hypothetical protein
MFTMAVAMAMSMRKYVEVCQHKEPREPGIPPPEWIGNPAIQVCIIHRWSIVCDNRGPFVVIVVVNSGRVRICRGSHSGRILTGGIRLYRQSIFCYHTTEGRKCRIFTHDQITGVCCFTY